MNTTGVLPNPGAKPVAGSAGAVAPTKAITAHLPTKVGLGLLVALVVDSIIGRGLFGLPQNMAADGNAFRRVVASPLPLGVLGRQAIRWLLAHGALVIATDVPAVYLDRGQSAQRAIGNVTPQALAGHDLAAGSMGPKVGAARAFVLATGQRAVIGSRDRIEDMLAGTAGPQVCTEVADEAAFL